MSMDNPWLRRTDGQPLTSDEGVTALKLVYEIANMTKDGEPQPEGDEFVMENDDAYDTVHDLISRAREIYKMPHRMEDSQ